MQCTAVLTQCTASLEEGLRPDGCGRLLTVVGCSQWERVPGRGECVGWVEPCETLIAQLGTALCLCVVMLQGQVRVRGSGSRGSWPATAGDSNDKLREINVSRRQSTTIQTISNDLIDQSICGLDGFDPIVFILRHCLNLTGQLRESSDSSGPSSHFPSVLPVATTRRCHRRRAMTVVPQAPAGLDPSQSIPLTPPLPTAATTPTLRPEPSDPDRVPIPHRRTNTAAAAAAADMPRRQDHVTGKVSLTAHSNSRRTAAPLRVHCTAAAALCLRCAVRTH